MKRKIFYLFLTLIIMSLFFTGCSFFSPNAISKNWKGTITITNQNSALWYEDLSGQNHDGAYVTEIAFNFDWFSNPNKIIGGDIYINPVSHDSSEGSISNPPYTIVSGEYTSSGSKLTFNSAIVGKNFLFEGTVNNGVLTTSTVKEIINGNLSVVGTIAITAQQ